MSKSAMQQLAEVGQSVWLDYIDRKLLETGKLKELIGMGLRGMTSNPSIFNNAIGQSRDYDVKISSLKSQGKSGFEIYDELTIVDIQEATDLFKPVYDMTNGLDGYVSLEINPLLANKVDEQIKEGIRLFKKVKRPNCMIKVPSTEEGFLVVEELIANGVNVNITLIFSLEQYEKTVQAYWRGLNHLAEKGGNLKKVRSVASVFVSRIDTLVDKLLDERAAKETNAAKKQKWQSLKGKAAVANCHLIFEKFCQLHEGKAFKALHAKGANAQRVLWGSTSTKNPAYKDIKYVEELIAYPTVNTIPMNTLEAFLDHGEVKGAFHDDVSASQMFIKTLKSLGIDINAVCAQLLKEGCEAFNKSFESLLETIQKKSSQLSVAK